jgi:tetratricopeptide (TPR) repeat protein
MQSNRRFIWSAGLLALLGATLEEAHAKQAANRIQAALESQATLSSARDPRAELNNWQGVNGERNKQSKTLAIQSSGLSSLESLNQQTKQFSSSLRLKEGVGEGRFEAPGLFEFSTFVAQPQSGASATGSKDEDIEKLRITTIASIEKIIRQPGSASQRVELLLRLAELHAERHIYFLQREMTTYENAYEKWQKNHRSGVEPKFVQNQSLQSVNTATQILRNLVSQYPNHAKTPDALYQLGFLLTEMKSDSATLYFQRLIERFPKSKFIPDAHLALGEFHFSRNKFNDAMVHYQKVLQDRQNRSYPYAVYKLGWTFYNIRGSEEETIKNLQKSLVAFKLLVKFAQEAPKERKLGLLRKDALRDMVLVYADLGDISEAQSYFKSMNEPELYATLLERLAWLHAEAGRNRESAEIYSRLVEEFPLSPKNPQFMVRLAALHEKDKRREMLINALERASEMIQRGSKWSVAQKKEQDRDNASDALLKETALWSLRFHAEFQKTKNKKTAQESLQLYDLTLKHHAESVASYTTLFNRAQLLTALGEHDKAIDGYLKAAQLDKKLSLKRNESKVGLENAMAESEILLQERGAVTQKVAVLQPIESRLIRIIDLHSAMFPKDPERLAHLHRAAVLLFQANQIPQANQRWMSMAKENPSSVHVSEGLRLVVKRSFDASDWIRAGQETKQFLAIPGISAAPVGAQLSKLQRVAHFQQGLVLEKSGRYSEAAQIFLDFQKQFSSDPDASKALVNAANNQFKNNRPDNALATLERFVVQYPQSEYKSKALELMSATAEGMGRYSDAAKALEQLAARNNNLEISAQDLHRAAKFRLADGNPTQAIANLQSALPNLKRSNDMCEAYKTVFDAQNQIRSTQVLETAKVATQRCQTASPEWGIYFAGMAARISMNSNQASEASRLSTLALSRGRILKGKLQSPFAFEGLRLAGVVQLELLETQSRTLIGKRIANSNAIQVEFGQIKNEAHSLAQQYAQLAQVGQAETSVGALYRVAEIQESLASMLVQSPNPSGVSATEIETFRTRIEKIALPLQEEATQLYTQALEKANEAEIISPYTILLQEKLSAARPGEFRKVIEVMPKPSYMAHELPINKETKGIVQEE